MARARNSWTCRTLYIKNRMEAGEESQLTPQSPRGRRSGREIAALAIVVALLAGLALRLWMLRNVFEVNGDSLIYGGLAKNLLLHGRFDLTLPSGRMYPTLIRLPGYPIFLALCFQALRDGELLFRGVRADCARSARLPAAGGFRPADRACRAGPGRGAGDTLAGGAVPVYCFLHG